MITYPNEMLDHLGYDKVIARLVARCHGEPAAQKAAALRPGADLGEIERSLDETAELIRLRELGASVPLQQYEDIEPLYGQITIEDFVLDPDSFRKVLRIIAMYSDIRAFFGREIAGDTTLLSGRVALAADPEDLLSVFRKVFDAEGEIRDNASPELARIQSMIRSKQGELDKTFRQLSGSFRQKGWLTETVESVRNGRRVLAVPAEHKRKIKGIIHDESSSGKTVFLEPVEIAEINNEIFNFLQERKREIRKILKALTARLAEHLEELQQWYADIVHLDLVSARARLAHELDGRRPVVQEEPVFSVRSAKHPLLILKSREDGKDVVAYDLTLHPPNRILVVSGPNAGGKSVLLKSVGLQQCMLQSGLMVPCHPESVFGIFRQVFADIGDQQSLENDLSTYSSHLSNMKAFAEQGDERTLVLIDEFGSGTDPRSGGAIAESVLRHLNRRECYGLVTTHYSNLKMFAYREKGIVNGGLLFDMETLMPTFQLVIGKPGSSFAFEIAKQVGLDNRLLGYARRRMGKGERKVDDLLVSLQKEKQEVGEKLATLKTQEKQMRQLRKNFDHLSRELDIKRKKIKIEQKESLLQIQAQESVRLEELIREIKKKNKLEEARRELRKLKQQREAEIEEVHEIKKELQTMEINDRKAGPLEEGDYVRMRSGTSYGQIREIRKEVATVEMGMITLDIPVHELEKIKEPLEVREGRSVRTDLIGSTASFRSRIDIRGLRMKEAIQTVEVYLDKALMAGVSSLTILHGKGNGILRKAVIRKLRDYPQVKSWAHPGEDQGGDGVTIVSL